LLREAQAIEKYFPAPQNHEYANWFISLPHGQRMAMKVVVGSPLFTRTTSIHGTSIGIAFATTRVLTQTLSNLVTGNQELLDQFWSVHMDIPEEQSVLM
jgi:hypothetical protein